jgi:glutamate dehydrogenase (NAD(P)+)
VTALSKDKVLIPKTLTQDFDNLNITTFLDKWGPEQIVQVYDPDIKMLGFLIIDNTFLGPSIGGLRISNTTTPFDAFQLARTMTLKSALYDYCYGGGMAVIYANPFTDQKKHLIKSFAEKISQYVPNRFIASPDMNIEEDDLLLFANTIGDMKAVTGKPVKKGGIPASLGSVGFGIGISLETAINVYNEYNKSDNNIGRRIVIQGFGKVGLGLAKYLHSKNFKIVGICDYWGAIHDPKGLDIPSIEKYSSAQEEKESLKSIRRSKCLPRDELCSIDCDIFIPCACERTITKDNWNNVKGKVIVEGANKALSSIAEYELIKYKKLIVPDLIANVGGLISSYSEYKQINVNETFSIIQTSIETVTRQILEQSLESGVSMRRIASEIAKEKILSAMEDK